MLLKQNCYLSHVIKKIVIIGPESTGKSTLAAQLAAHFDTRWVPEFAREFLLTNGTHYEYDDLLTVAKGQLALEDEHTNALETQSQQLLEAGGHLPLFIDTDMYVMKVWCEFVFENCHHWILDQVVHRRYDLYLLCNTDLPWVKDELREYPDIENRLKLYHIYKDIMINQQTRWVDIRGSYAERFEKAKAAVDVLLSK